MKTVVLLICCVSALCSVYGSELDAKCAWGESYWCSSLRVAKSCGAVAHCSTTVWKNQIIKPDGTEVCQFCKSILGDIKKFIEEKKTQEQISHFLSTACGVIPKQSVAAECRYVSEFLMQELVELISAELDPQMLCSLLGLCTGSEDHVLHSPVSQTSTDKKTLNTVTDNKKFSPLVGVSGEPICTDCTKFFTDIKNMITANKTANEVEQLIDTAVCSILGRLEDECKSLVHEFIPEILEILATYYDPNLICQSLGVCAQDLEHAKNFLLFQRLQKMPLYGAAKQSSVETCIMCKAVMLELQTLDRNKDVQSEVSSIIKTQLCVHLGSLKDACQTTVDMYGPELFELLATELDPSTRCRSLGFCSPSSYNSQPMAELTPARQPMVELHPAVQPMAELHHAKQSRAVVQPAPISQSPQCMLCEFVVKEVKSMISTNATEEEIMDALEKVCDYFPQSLRPDCKNFVEQYGRAVIDLLLTELDPEQVCTEIGLCDEKKLATYTTTTIKTPVLGDSEACMVCQTIVQYLEALLEQNSTVVEIETVLHKICGYVPSALTQQCNIIVDQYGDQIIYFISMAITPKQVCTLAHVCGDHKVDMTKSSIVPHSESRHDEDVVVKVKAPVLGQNECTWGPAYWCASRQNADKCNAVDHCKRTVWNQ